MKTLHHYYARLALLTHQCPALRPGQQRYNALHDVAPDVARRIRGTDLDPFYCDQRSPRLALFDRWIVDELGHEQHVCSVPGCRDYAVDQGKEVKPSVCAKHDPGR